MALRAILARETGTDYLIRVHLDTAKLKDDRPDPEWVAEYRFGRQPPAGVTPTNYRAAIRAEVRGLAQQELAKRQARAGDDPGGTALNFEGQEL